MYFVLQWGGGSQGAVGDGGDSQLETAQVERQDSKIQSPCRDRRSNKWYRVFNVKTKHE